MSYTTASVEVLVIGGGVTGSSIAYHVAQQGRNVLVVERNEIAVEPAASWASAGGVRPQGMEPAEAALACAALARWPTLPEELEADLQYRQGGHLLLAENEVEAEHLHTFVQRQHELGLADVSFVDREAVFHLVPGLGEQVVAGSFSPASGQADPRLTTRAFANAAKRNGAIYWTSTECLALQRVADRVGGAQTGRGTVQAEQIVLATGAWSRELASSIGIHLPLRGRVLQALSLDGLPFMGSFSGLEGLTLALGSWYGFALSPAIGTLVADHVAGRPTPELDQLPPNRITQFDPAGVAAFLAEPATANVVA